MPITVKPKPIAVTQYSIPEHLRESNPELIKFLEYYYKWMAQDGYALDLLQNLIEYRNIDTTSTAYTKLITHQLMEFIPATANVNQNLLATHIKDFYQAKGTLPSYDFIMNLLFGSRANIEWNSEKVFRPSSNISIRDGFMFTYSDTPWPPQVIGSTIIQTYPTYATALIESTTPVIINNKIINYLDIDPESVQGTFAPYGLVKVLNNTIDRSFTYIDIYYTPVSLIGNELVMTIYEEPNRSYPGMIVRQVGSTFRAVITELDARLVVNSQTQLSLFLDVTSITGTLGAGDLYLVSPLIEETTYTKGDFFTGIVSPTITDIQITSGGSLAETGEDISYYGGAGSPFVAKVDAIGSGPVEHIEITSGGYGYSVGDALVVHTDETSGAGLSAVVDKVDGFGATASVILELDNFNIRNGGNSYAVGDVITLIDGTYPIELMPTQFTVSSINNTLALNSINVLAGGYGYQYAKMALLDTTSNTLVSSFAATAVLSAGSVASVNITSYPTLTHSTLSVLINGSGAIVTATTSAGTINSITISNGGFNYVNPVITINSSITPSSLAQFAVTKDVNGTITGISILNGGSGYSSTVTVTVSELTGAGATFYPVVNNTTGPVTGLTITHRGDYSILPTCFNSPYITNSVAGNGLIIDLKYRVKSVTVDEPGSHYKVIALDTSYGIGSGALIQPIIDNGVIKSFNITNQGSGYTYAHILINSTGTGFTGTATIVAGAITGVVVITGGHGYSNTDIVTVVGDGINASLSLNVANGVVTSFNVINNGNNYAYDTAISFVMDPVANPSAVAGTFIPVLDGGQIDSITVVDGGAGYIGGLTNELKNEDGTFLLNEDGTNIDFDSPYDVPLINAGAPARILLDKAPLGAVVSANVIAGGSGYYDTAEVPTLEVYINSLTGHGASVIPVLELGKICAFEILHGGVGYQSTDTASIVGGGGTGAAITPVFNNGRLVDIIITNRGSGYKYGTSTLVVGNGYDADMYPHVNTSIQQVKIINGGSGYTNPSITVTDITGSGAILIPTVNSSGTITSVRIVSGGTLYTSPQLSVTGGGSGAVLQAVVPRNIESISILDPGEDYTYADVYLTGDGDDATISINLELAGSIYNPQLYVQGTGYTVTPNFTFTDVSGVGEITSVNILNGGDLYSEPPLITIPDKYQQASVVATGASFISWGSNIGSVKSVTFTQFGSDWTEPPLFTFPVNAILESNSNFVVGETVSLERYPYKAQDTVFDLFTELSERILVEIKVGYFKNEDGTYLLNEDSIAGSPDYLDIEDIGDLEQEFMEVFDSNGNGTPYYDAGPTATVYGMDFSKNIIELKNVSDQFTLISEDGTELRSETDLTFVTQESNGFNIGDRIVGNTSNAKAVLKWFNRVSGVHKTSGVGLTKKTMTNSTGVLNHPLSKIHDGQRIQDFAYVVKTNGVTSDKYKQVLVDVVHPAGYEMFSDVNFADFTKGSSVSVPYSFGIKGADASFTTTMSIKNSFGNLELGQLLNLQYYDATKSSMYTTQASFLAGYSFVNFDPTSIYFVQNISPLFAIEPYVAKEWNVVGSATAGSDQITGITTPAISIGYRVIAYDSNGNNIFQENKLKNEDGTYLLNEDSVVGTPDYIDTDELMVTVASFTSTTLQTSKYSKTSGTVTAVIENIPSLHLP
jgi:hypothetical protein